MTAERRLGAAGPGARGKARALSRAVMIGALAGSAVACRSPAEAPVWTEAFGYAPHALHEFRIGDFGFPFVPVQIHGDTLNLLFDTGNMAGLTVSSRVFRRLGLPCSDTWNLLDSAGDVVSTGCTAHGVQVAAFGAGRPSHTVLEFFDETLSGLVGPDLLPGTRFTMDYGSGILASDSVRTPTTVPGFASLPLVRSSHDPYLVLVRGAVNGHPVLVEIDTGKSRTTVDEELVRALSLERSENGAMVGRVSLGQLEWTVGSARVVNTSGISEGLPDRVSLGIGSDILRNVVFTVDYAAGRIWMAATSGSQPR